MDEAVDVVFGDRLGDAGCAFDVYVFEVEVSGVVWRISFVGRFAQIEEGRVTYLVGYSRPTRL